MQHNEEIRLIAYHIWEEQGRPDGRDLEHWLKAEAIWQEKSGPQALPSRTAPAPRVAAEKKPASTPPRRSRQWPQ
jgi:hypothetical protein